MLARLICLFLDHVLDDSPEPIAGFLVGWCGRCGKFTAVKIR